MLEVLKGMERERGLVNSGVAGGSGRKPKLRWRREGGEPVLI